MGGNYSRPKLTDPYKLVVGKALQLMKKKGYVTDRDLEIAFDEILLGAIKPFLPENYRGDIFDSDFINGQHYALQKKFEGVKGMKKKQLKDPDVVGTVYSLSSENLNKAYKAEQSGVGKRGKDLPQSKLIS